MENLDIKAIVADAVSLAKNEIGKSWTKLAPYAEHEFGQFAESAAFITRLHLADKISEEEYKARLEFQKIALNNVLTTIEGIGLITAQNTVNGVIDIVRTALRTATGFTLPL